MLLGIIFSYFLLDSITKETPVIVTYQGNTLEEDKPEAKKVRTSVSRKPSAPSSAMAKTITSTAKSAVSIPVPDQIVDVQSVSFGDGEDFGSGWGDGLGAGGGGGGFGSGSAGSGGLPGILYDLKQDRKKKPLQISTSIYSSALEEIQEDFRESKLGKYFQAPKSLFLTHLAVPLKNASEGPASFKAEDSIKPMFWMAHYSGNVVVPRTGTYRFSGTGDNYLHVKVDGQTRLHFGTGHPKGWKPTAPSGENHQSPFVKGWSLHYGDWIDLRAGQIIRLDIGIGESAGGMLGFILHIEERGENYRKDKSNNNRRSFLCSQRPLSLTKRSSACVPSSAVTRSISRKCRFSAS